MIDVFIYYTTNSDYQIDIIFKLSGYTPIGGIHTDTPYMKGYYCSNIKTPHIDLFGSFAEHSRIHLRQNVSYEEEYNFIIVNREEFLEKLNDSLQENFKVE